MASSTYATSRHSTQGAKGTTNTNTSTRILALGANSSGQLGLSHRDDISTPQSCRLLAGRIGFDSASGSAPGRLRLLNGGETIVQIAAGGNHTLLLTSWGRALVAGGEDLSESASGYNVEPGPERLGFREVDLSAASLETDERAGHGERVASGTMLDKGGRLTHIAATWDASFFVRDSTYVYAYGTGAKGELGLGKEQTTTRTTTTTAASPKLILDIRSMSKETTRIASISAGMGHVVLVTTDGRLFGWGGSRKGQLGSDLVSEKVVWSPHEILLPEDPSSLIHAAAVGRDFTCVVDERGNSTFLGDRKNFPDLPRKTERSLESPHGSPFSSFDIFAGWSNVFIWDDQTRKLEGFGRNNHGQLPPKDLPSLSLFAAGSEHCVAASDNKVLIWGWGEHGNCGLPIDDRGNVIARWNELPLELGPGEEISFLGAGCATTFIVVTKDDG